MMVYSWQVLFLLFNLCIIFYDMKHRRVPNRLILIGLVGQTVVLLVVATGIFPLLQPPVFWSAALMGLLVALGMFYPLWRFRSMGAGDVKFIALVGYCLGLPSLLFALLVGSLLAGVHAIAYVAWFGWKASRREWTLAPNTRRGLPYAAYVSVGAIASQAWRLAG
ncbi:MAG: prepilin peptidase [Burkholderiaceae bacterium]|nr:prepilin peptidase [Burkholderiaceae bacterium]